MQATSGQRPVVLIRFIVCLFTLLVPGFAASSGAQNDMASGFVPTPNKADLRVATDHWLVWERMDVIDPRSHLPKATYRYYLQPNLNEAAQLVYQYTATVYQREIVRGVLDDGTLVMEKIGTALYLVKRDGTRTVASGYPVRITQEMAEFLAVYDDGVLVRAGDPNKYKPVYFIPWSASGLDISKMFMISDETGMKAGFTTQVFRKGNVVALYGTRLMLFDLTRRKAEYYSFGWLPRWFPAIHAFDGETVVFGTGYYGCATGSNYDCYTKPGLDIKTGQQFLGVVAGCTIAVKNKMAYVIQAKESSCDQARCAVQLVAYDLRSTDDRKRMLIDLKGIKPTEVTYLTRDDALQVWTGQEWKRIEWLSESHSRNQPRP
jgi:hypothetical protein